MPHAIFRINREFCWSSIWVFVCVCVWGCVSILRWPVSITNGQLICSRWLMSHLSRTHFVFVFLPHSVLCSSTEKPICPVDYQFYPSVLPSLAACCVCRAISLSGYFVAFTATQPNGRNGAIIIMNFVCDTFSQRLLVQRSTIKDAKKNNKRAANERSANIHLQGNLAETINGNLHTFGFSASHCKQKQRQT